MFKATAETLLPTSIIGSLPRPRWYEEDLWNRSFLQAMSNSRYREQYEDVVSVHLKAQELAGIDICTDGDAHYDEQVAGASWQTYPPYHMAGFDTGVPDPAVYHVGAVGWARGHILHDFLEARVMPKIVGPVGPGNLHYAPMWKAAQRLTSRPVKFGTITPELLAAGVDDEFYKDPVDRVMALSDALNTELHALADAGCPAIQMEEPQIHMTPVRGKLFGKLGEKELVEIFNNTVRGLRDKTEIWCHTCWGNPAQQRIFREVQSYQPTLEYLEQLDADVLTFETASSGTADLPAIGKVITEKKVAIGVVNHHTLQVERPDEVADLIKVALEHVPAERLVITTDCGMGREGMSRRHAVYKIIALVQGTNIVRKEQGLPQAEIRAEIPDLSLTMQAK